MPKRASSIKALYLRSDFPKDSDGESVPFCFLVQLVDCIERLKLDACFRVQFFKRNNGMHFVDNRVRA